MLCDFEQAGIEPLAELRGVLDPGAGSAALVLQLLLADPVTRSLDPVLMTGGAVACSKRTAVKLAEWCRVAAPELVGPLAAIATPAAGEAGWDDVVALDPEGVAWTPRRYVPIVTRFFEEGGSQCLVGTRGLLGEGWDAKTVNVLIDLTGASTSTSVHQMRGRSLRLDPRLPRKVADNWDVVCVAPEHPKGLADYFRFVRKHRAYYALAATGEIECGVSHVDPALSPFGPPSAEEAVALDARTLERVRRREQAYAEWRVGDAYRNVETETVRIRFNRPIGLPLRRAAKAAVDFAEPSIGAYWLLGSAAVFFIGAAIAVGDLVPGLAVLGTGIAAALGWGVQAIARAGRHMTQDDTLGDLAGAVADALAATGGVDRSLCAANVRIMAQPDGYYRCYLDGASTADSLAFADALDELLAPLESPRYIIPRKIVDPPRTRAGLAGRAAYALVGAPRARVVYHAVPSYLAANKERVAAFEHSWHRWVGPGEALFSRDPKAQGILALQRDADEFGTLSQMRTLWT